MASVSEIEGLNPKLWANVTSAGPVELDDWLDWVLEVAWYISRIGWDPVVQFVDREMEPWQHEAFLECLMECLDWIDWMKSEVSRSGGVNNHAQPR